MGYNIATDSPFSTPVTSGVEQWIENYKNSFIEHSHDQSMLSLANPDNNLIVVGPPRLAMKDANKDLSLYVVGFVQNIQYSESAQVQPLKAIGSSRHIFAKTNAPIQGSIGRMIVLGSNLARALYAVTTPSSAISDRNSMYAVGGKGEKSSWFTNLEEDLYRMPFGLGIIYNSPATMAEGANTHIGAEYLESCVLVSRSVSSQMGQSMIMEQVTFMADRVRPWDAYAGPEFKTDYNNHVGDILK